MSRSVDVVVTGRVQGVAFRDGAQREARRLGVRGWVRNEPDGSVAVHAEGDDEAVAALVEWCRHGPSYAEVEDLRVTDAAEGGHGSFEVRF